MKNLLLSAMLITSVSSIAQLYVTPNGATDSYVYVNDEVLFVEQDVNLVENNAGTTRASIYLRNQSQLIQGSTSSANSGTGYISIMQNAPADDAWDYSFWSSPVGNQALGASGNENFGILRIHDSLSVTNSIAATTTAAHNGTVSPMRISRRWLYKHPAGVNNWQSINNNYIVDPGLGFTMKGLGTTNHNQIYDFRGRPNNGDITVAVINNAHTLSGNPYPSALDLNRVFYEPGNNEINEFWFWDEDRTINSHLFVANKGGYGTWVPGASDPNGTNPGTYVPAVFLNYDAGGNPSGGSTGTGNSYQRRFSPVGQGFMIYADGTGDITFRNSHRRYIIEGAANNSQYRNPVTGDPVTGINTQPSIRPADNRLPHYRINTIFGESHTRQLVLAFSPESTDGFDRGYDGRSPADATSDAFFPVTFNSEIKPFVINTVPFEVSKVIPLTVKIANEFTKLEVIAVERINTNQRAYLLDAATNLRQRITEGYSADVNLDPGVYENRFYIVFTNGSDISASAEPDQQTLIRESIIENVDVFQNNPATQLEISNPEGYTLKDASVYDMAGKLVIHEKNLGDSSRYAFSTANLSDGIYLVKLTTKEDVVVDYKVTVHNKR
ncbi:T9SS type A sorting domain-containing protein [Constantimarinum furrinae]|uniref:Secretion system C-terminal sorting domain-containing protein n=1 Tax=Constantimarinum furrinae TaxID=2562285 RepID=A0A7G8PX36_9FLAO|nr:T9SS type A sorting domain-containing protein [Constantimarinum furrinae]QNJ98902.1 hypothetical protein ALE3EI_2363 [Constantimarinum furrinae]